VVVPHTNGAGWTFAGLAGDAGHFIAVRPGAAAGGLADAVVYTSDDAVNWHFATTIDGPAAFPPRPVTAGSGDTGRFAVTGRDRQGHVVAYTSTAPPLLSREDRGVRAAPLSVRGDIPAGHRLVAELSNDEPLFDEHNSLLPPDVFHLPAGPPSRT
jgi:hypothetical protein